MTQPRPDASPSAPIPFGRYQLLRRIGAGGMGEVYLAREESGTTPRACVVKKVLPHLTENRAFVGRFKDEARMVVRLKHPNIARVYAMGEVGTEYFLAMEYVQGKTISRFTRRLRERKQVLPLGHILLLGERICQGLAYAHDVTDESGEPLHLVHRDLSPANVCVSYRGEVKIIDFGAAQSTLKEEQTAPRVVIGNLTYMAPEQAKKQHVDRRADVYACGVVLWELFAWYALPQKGDPVERWRKAANPSWEAPSRHRASLPADVDAVILKALHKDPAERYPDAVAFGRELARLRQKHAPDVSEKKLGQLLSSMFEKEKEAEDEVLELAARGVPIDQPPTDPKGRPFFVPPTALAFEHKVDIVPGAEDVTAPGREAAAPPPRAEPVETFDNAHTQIDHGRVAEMLAELDSNRAPAVTGPGATLDHPEPRPLGVTDPGPTRFSFGITFDERTAPGHEQSQSLIREIEAISEELPGSPWLTSTNRGLWILLFIGAFAAACGLGFLVYWLASR